MDRRIRCPRCGGEMEVKSERNPIRSVVREVISCRNCGYRDVKERPPDVTLGDWWKKE